MISIQNITFGYKKNQPVLSNFSLEFQKSGVYGLLGKNGTGKSTLLYIMMGLLQPQQGNVSVDGICTLQRSPEVLRHMFLVPEEYDLPPVPLADYVQALKPFYPNFSEDVLKRCLADFDMSFDINLGALSMGQKKKVYMSVAIATCTRYLLMDEPTNGLDILSKSQFGKVLAEGLTDDRIIIISTHQVHDVERLLDYVCIVDCNRILLNEQLPKDGENVNLEELFIKTLLGHETV